LFKREDREKSYKPQAASFKLEDTGNKIVVDSPSNKKAGESKIHLPYTNYYPLEACDLQLVACSLKN